MLIGVSKGRLSTVERRLQTIQRLGLEEGNIVVKGRMDG